MVFRLVSLFTNPENNHFLSGFGQQEVLLGNKMVLPKGLKRRNSVGTSVTSAPRTWVVRRCQRHVNSGSENMGSLQKGPPHVSPTHIQAAVRILQAIHADRPGSIALGDLQVLPVGHQPVGQLTG